MMSVPVFSEELGTNGGWFPMYVKTLKTGQHAGEFPTVEEMAMEMKRSLSFLEDDVERDSEVAIHLWSCKMPPGVSQCRGKKKALRLSIKSRCRIGGS